MITIAVATIAKLEAHNLHRTFTHSILTALVIVAVFVIVALASRQRRWANLGAGLGIGIGLHIVLDLLIWFNGVELLWPVGGWLNLWEGIKPPDWFTKFLDPAEFLFLGLFFFWLAKAAQAHKTNLDFLGTLRVWTIVMFLLLVVFTPLAYILNKGFLTIFGVFYLISITAALVITIRMQQTLEAYG